MNSSRMALILQFTFHTPDARKEVTFIAYGDMGTPLKWPRVATMMNLLEQKSKNTDFIIHCGDLVTLSSSFTNFLGLRFWKFYDMGFLVSRNRTSGSE
jgi:hypothetical protein